MHEIYAPPSAKLSEPDVGSKHRAGKLLALGLMLLLGGIYGSLAQYFRPEDLPPVFDWPIFILFTASVYIWYRMDVIQHSYQRSRWLDVGVVLLPIAALPFYFLRSRGWKQGFLAILLLFLAGAGFAMMAGIGAGAMAWLQF